MAKREYSAAEKAQFQAKRKSEVDYLCGQIEEGIVQLRSSDRYLEYLKVMSRFHDYSYANLMLILKACPGATFVAGFNEWKKLGRYVERGQTGIRILAPMVYKRDAVDSDSERKKVIAGFKPVSVFDISQTSGKPLPKLASPLEGDVQGFDRLFSALEKSQNARVDRMPLSEDVYGYYDPRTDKIVLRNDLSQAHALKTLIHEIAHKRMHPLGNMIPKAEREIQAESVAYVACAHFGLDTGNYSLGYLDSWLGGKDAGPLRQSLETISYHARDIIRATEHVLEKELSRSIESPKKDLQTKDCSMER